MPISGELRGAVRAVSLSSGRVRQEAGQHQAEERSDAEKQDGYRHGQGERLSARRTLPFTAQGIEQLLDRVRIDVVTDQNEPRPSIGGWPRIEPQEGCMLCCTACTTSGVSVSPSTDTMPFSLISRVPAAFFNSSRNNESCA